MRIVVKEEDEKFECICCHTCLEEGVDYCSNCGAGIDWIY